VQDNDSVMWARIRVLSSSCSRHDKVAAYRILAKAYPLSYRQRLVEALTGLAFEGGAYREPSAWRLSLMEEAAEAARGIDPDLPRRTGILVQVLGWYRRELCWMGRRSEALAVTRELGALGATGPCADGLAEEGFHSEAADLYRQAVKQNPGTSGFLALAAELDAAGRRGEALAAFRELVALQQEKTELVIALVTCARMWSEARPALREAVGLVRELAAVGGRKSWSGHRFSFLVPLLHFSCDRQERAAWGVPGPRPRATMVFWPPDLRDRYIASLPELRQAIEEADVARRVGLTRRLAVRSAVVEEWRRGLSMGEVLPAFDDSVKAGHAAGDEQALGEALLDRASFLTAMERHAEALADLEEVMALRNAGPSVI
jgi:tetratricopeptide (TPR) repeat protein